MPVNPKNEISTTGIGASLYFFVGLINLSTRFFTNEMSIFGVINALIELKYLLTL